MVTSRASLLLMLLLHVRPPAPFRHDQHQMLLLMFAHAQVTHPFIQFYSELNWLTEPSWWLVGSVEINLFICRSALNTNRPTTQPTGNNHSNVWKSFLIDLLSTVYYDYWQVCSPLWMTMWDNIVACTYLVHCLSGYFANTHGSSISNEKTRGTRVLQVNKSKQRMSWSLHSPTCVLELRRGNPLPTARLGALSCLQIHIASAVWSGHSSQYPTHRQARSWCALREVPELRQKKINKRKRACLVLLAISTHLAYSNDQHVLEQLINYLEDGY